MTTLKTNCEACKRSIAYPSSRAGSRAKCPGCQSSLVLPDALASEPEATPTLPIVPAVNMPTIAKTSATLTHSEPFAALRQYAGFLFFAGWAAGLASFAATGFALQHFSATVPNAIGFVAVAIAGLVAILGSFMLIVASDVLNVFLAIERNTRK